jgi:hypothetical protein
LESDNQLFANLVLDNETGTSFLIGPPEYQAEIESSFVKKPCASAVSKTFRLLVPLYWLLLLVGWPLTLMALLAGLWRLDWKILAVTAIPLAFFTVHALVLMSVDRLLLPAYPLVVANLFLLPTWLVAWLRRVP